MLNKPKFMKPSTNKEECTIDLTADKIPFSCIVDGNEAITHWQIVIYRIEDDDNPVFDSGTIPLDPPVYPVDEKNRNVVFEVDLSEHIKEHPNFINRQEAYYWTMTLWTRSEHSVTSYQEVFYANKTPEATISYKYLIEGDEYKALSSKKEDNILASRACTFKGELNFGDNVQEYRAQLKRYGWRIKDTDSGQVFVDTITKNQIYGSADNIICTYDGFLNGGNYSVELFVETQNNKKITSDPIYFTVSYASTFLSNDFKVEALQNEPAIMLDWGKTLVISGILKDADDNVVHIEDTVFKANYPVNKQCSIEIPENSKVIYDKNSSLNFNIDENSYIALSTQLLSNKKTELFFAYGADDMGYELGRKLSYDSGVFTYEVIGHNNKDEKSPENYKKITATARCEDEINPSEYVWYNILMSPLIKSEDGEYSVNLEISSSSVDDCVYPSEDLYPMDESETSAWNNNYYPIFGRWKSELEVG